MEILKTGFVKHLVLVALTSLCICAWTSEVHAQTKNTNDVKALQNIIATQKKKGAKISTDINNKKQYKWDKTGRLQTVQWRKKNLKGKISFGALKELKYLNVSKNKITGLNADGLEKLKILDCSKNALKKINVKSNVRLGVFHCSENRLKRLSVLKNKQLYDLNCSNNRIKTLKLAQSMKKLSDLNCSHNRLKKLKLSKSMKNLFDLDCSYNKLSSLYINGLGMLEYFHCHHNRLKKLVLKHLTDIRIFCDYNRLKKLDFSDVFIFDLWCSHNQLELINTYVDESLDCSYNNIREIKGTFCGQMLRCDHNQLTKLDITKIANGEDYYTEVDCSYNKISELKADFSKSLLTLKCDHNPLTELEVQQPGRRLTEITCDNTLQFTGVAPEHLYDGVTGITVSSLWADEGTIYPKIKNTARRWLLVPVSLILEKKSGNVWKKMEFTKNTSLKTVLLIPKEKTANLKLSLKWKDFFGKRLGKGKYRVTFFGKQRMFTVS